MLDADLWHFRVVHTGRWTSGTLTRRGGRDTKKRAEKVQKGKPRFRPKEEESNGTME